MNSSDSHSGVQEGVRDTRKGANDAVARSFKLQRTTSRRLALQLLYALETNLGWAEPLPESLDAFLDLIFQEQPREEDSSADTDLPKLPPALPRALLRKSWSHSRRLVEGIRQKKDDLDQKISAAAKNWPLSRISLVDRNILRLATYEMLYAERTVMPGIAINEAVDLAHQFGQKDSWRFVNGVLDSIRKTSTPATCSFGGTE